ncbi:CGNR zinc finger domain-containing protein [Cupriavidus campinensis]|uniref:Zinc finger CGNR domain-containing protein n=1 Tax=Cupriavidus campinensis TaxID=151783 RepID=A0ABY3ER51_9BURK|nr:ABATE domain-containing protein [Cupriavidus campinensis]TSP13440.1 hypothetical protein FGG12_07285 [Cupriavidus campinensis]
MPASNTAPPNPANPANPAATPESGPRLLADHVALDLLNTIERADTTPHDHWQTDADVLAWLKQVALWPGDDRAAPPKGLATAARALREAVRLIVARRKAGAKPDLAPLNDALAAGGSHLAVHPLPEGGVRIARIHAAANAAQCLVPLAEAAADLLAHGDFRRVRQCESDECTLWFYDRTKSHRRRWCSMALCGNRHKVAAFRKREAAADEGAA